MPGFTETEQYTCSSYSALNSQLWWSNNSSHAHHTLNAIKKKHTSTASNRAPVKTTAAATFACHECRPSASYSPYAW